MLVFWWQLTGEPTIAWFSGGSLDVGEGVLLCVLLLTFYGALRTRRPT